MSVNTSKTGTGCDSTGVPSAGPHPSPSGGPSLEEAMRSLALLGLIALSTLPLAARDHGWHRGSWRGRYADPRPRVWVAERGRWIDRDRCGEDRWEGRPVRWERRYDDDCGDNGYGCEDGGVVVVRPVPRPLPPPPGRVRVELHLGW